MEDGGRLWIGNVASIFHQFDEDREFVVQRVDIEMPKAAMDHREREREREREWK